ncbi:peptidoglycan DD-metalloendopeptidase family protein [Streptomyces sp. NPDC088554]|uniref:peptidoglycan DD-metalloendopeptidase family protein n=1 Tax=Streptomyces sp. NPDC088554 TaxID=3365865 RepID=UPI0037F75E03
MRLRKLANTLYRVGMLVYVALILGDLTGLWRFSPWVLIPFATALVALFFVARRTGRKAAEKRRTPPPPLEVAVPVTGSWTALNSPADKVPSHGTHGYGQTYAIDIVADPEPGSGGTRPAFAKVWPIVRRNRDFPAFDQPILAVADATVVHAGGGQRDHLSRNSLPALGYLMLLESGVREIGGARFIVGNHLVLDLGDGTYAMYAHLRRGSLSVRAGDRVHAGQVLARCGNSGNSTEPHLHFQLMDHPDLDVAQGVPFTWQGIGVPANGEAFGGVERQDRRASAERVEETGR